MFFLIVCAVPLVLGRWCAPTNPSASRERGVLHASAAHPSHMSARPSWCRHTFQVQCRRVEKQVSWGLCDPSDFTLTCCFPSTQTFVRFGDTCFSYRWHRSGEQVATLECISLFVILINVLYSGAPLVSSLAVSLSGILCSGLPVPPSGSQSERG